MSKFKHVFGNVFGTMLDHFGSPEAPLIFFRTLFRPRSPHGTQRALGPNFGECLESCWSVLRGIWLDFFVLFHFFLVRPHTHTHTHHHPPGCSTRPRHKSRATPSFTLFRSTRSAPHRRAGAESSQHHLLHFVAQPWEARRDPAKRAQSARPLVGQGVFDP